MHGLLIIAVCTAKRWYLSSTCYMMNIMNAKLIYVITCSKCPVIIVWRRPRIQNAQWSDGGTFKNMWSVINGLMETNSACRMNYVGIFNKWPGMVWGLHIECGRCLLRNVCYVTPDWCFNFYKRCYFVVCFNVSVLWPSRLCATTVVMWSGALRIIYILLCIRRELWDIGLFWGKRHTTVG